ncbi:MAG TPA: hypothetical protein VE570_10500 [Thermoleophilaceae bacterium]|nr:hypothetical protein [Thermoleophilaceae bacterium]
MRSVAAWSVATAIGLAALAGFVALVGSRDQSGVDQHASVTAGPGKPYRGEPVLSPALQDAVRRGNVVVLYRDDKPPAGTDRLVPPGGRALVHAGQAVVLDREPTLKAPLAAVSAKKMEEASAPRDLEPFIDYWLGGR